MGGPREWAGGKGRAGWAWLGRGEGALGCAGWGAGPFSFLLFLSLPFYLKLLLVLNSKYTMPYESRRMHNKTQSSSKKWVLQHDAIIKILLGFHFTTLKTCIYITK
jgi:hypothetical protein